MRVQQSNIALLKKNKKPFISNGKKEPFVKSKELEKSNIRLAKGEERSANHFAQQAAEIPEITQLFHRLQFKKNNKASLPNQSTGVPLPHELIVAFKKNFNLDFSDVQIHNDTVSTNLAMQYNAAAFTVQNHIFLNQHIFTENNVKQLEILAHELYHTINATQSILENVIQLKPLAALNDRTPEQQAALNRAARIGSGEQGKVNSGTLNEDQTRVGWQYLLEYFKSTLGEDTIISDKADYKQGKFLEENIKYLKKGKVQKIEIVNGIHTAVMKDNVDLLPSWCGIFVFWALHKGGVIMTKWELGKSAYSPKDAFKKGEYLPRTGDIVIKNGYNHFALVVKTDPETITDTAELKSLKVITINGNTAGSNHQGGQIQLKKDDYSYWDYYINPFFSGVTVVPTNEYQMDERLQTSLEETSNINTTIAKPDLSLNQYDTTLQPIANINAVQNTEDKTKQPEQKDDQNIANPKELMANDVAFNELQSSLKRNGVEQKKHDEPEDIAAVAQSNAISPSNERRSKAQAIKVEKMYALPPPKKFDAEELKKNILKEVDKLLKEKEEEANRTGNKPKIKEQEIKDVKQKSNEDIKQKKTVSIGNIEQAHEEEPDENSVAERTSTAVVLEDPGKNQKISDTDRAVAKPITDERITLESESENIDKKMEENDVDQQQLEESEEDKFTSAAKEKKDSQAEAAKVKEDYREKETSILDKDKSNAKKGINDKVTQIHDERKNEFGNVDTVKSETKSADELKRKEISDHIEKIYSDSEKSVTDKLATLETSVNTEFDNIMTTANNHFKENVNNALDEEFTWEWAAKHLDRSDYNRRVKKVFVAESEKYTKELSDALSPLTQKIADTLNAIMEEITAAKNAVIVYVNGLEPAMTEIGKQSASAVLDKFKSLEESVNEKQVILTNNLAKKYSDGVSSLEQQFKEIMDSRKSWLERALDAIVDAIKEIINLLSDLKKALERAVQYAGRIIKAPIRFFKNLVAGATRGFNNFVKNIGKHLLEGALAWVTGEMAEAGVQLPEKFDFKGILSIILQVLGITVANVKEIAKQVIGEKYVNMLEKGFDFGKKVGDKIFNIFNIIKKEGIAGLWEFIKEQFKDLKERLMEEAKNFAIKTIIEVAVVKIVSMLIPGAGFISAVKSLIDFVMTLFTKARQIVKIITGIIDTFGEILAGNVSKVASMVENVLAKFLALAISFLAAILGLGKIGKKINDIIQKKIKDPIKIAITKMMQKLKALMTKLGIFKLMDNIQGGISKGHEKIISTKDQVKKAAGNVLNKMKNFVKSKFKKQYTEKDGKLHTLQFNDNLKLERHSISRDLGNYLVALRNELHGSDRTEIEKAFTAYQEIITLIGNTVRNIGTTNNPQYSGTDNYFNDTTSTQLNVQLVIIANTLRNLPSLDATNENVIPETKINYTPISSGKDGKVAEATFLSLDPGSHSGSAASATSSLFQLMMNISGINRNKLIRGHLINHELYGSGTDISNLAPITARANSQMYRNFENAVKLLVHQNKIVSLKVSVTYDFPKNSTKGKKLKDALPKNTKLPVNIECKSALLTFKEDADKRDANIPGKWNAQDRPTVNVTNNHDEYF